MADDLSITGQSTAVASAKIGEQIVTQTLDKLNSGSTTPGASNDMENSYQLQKQVLSAVYEGKGTITDSEV